jgi:hypothetical protein
MSVSYFAVLAMPERTVFAVEDWLAQRRRDLGTRWRALTCMEQAVLVLRWFTDGTRVEQLALDNAIGLTTAYDYLHEGIDVIAQRAPSLHGALLAAKAAGYSHVDVDGMLVETDRCSEPGPTPAKPRKSGPKRARVDLWWSGKYHGHGGNVQVVTAPDGWPLWVSAVEPGRVHDITALRADEYLVPVLSEWTADDRKVLTDLGYVGEPDLLTTATKTPEGGELSEEQKEANKAHNRVRCLGERGNALLKGFKTLRRVSLCPWRIGAIVSAALVLLHHRHARTT